VSVEASIESARALLAEGKKKEALKSLEQLKRAAHKRGSVAELRTLLTAAGEFRQDIGSGPDSRSADRLIYAATQNIAELERKGRLAGDQSGTPTHAAPTPEPARARPSSSAEARFCASCGVALPKAVKFCPNCGERIIAAGTPDLPKQSAEELKAREAPAPTDLSPEIGSTPLPKQSASPPAAPAHQRSDLVKRASRYWQGRSRLGKIGIVTLAVLACFSLIGLFASGNGEPSKQADLATNATTTETVTSAPAPKPEPTSYRQLLKGPITPRSALRGSCADLRGVIDNWSEAAAFRLKNSEDAIGDEYAAANYQVKAAWVSNNQSAAFSNAIDRVVTRRLARGRKEGNSLGVEDGRGVPGRRVEGVQARCTSPDDHGAARSA
jgi:hypothetical protein